MSACCYALQVNPGVAVVEESGVVDAALDVLAADEMMMKKLMMRIAFLVKHISHKRNFVFFSFVVVMTEIMVVTTGMVVLKSVWKLPVVLHRKKIRIALMRLYFC